MTSRARHILLVLVMVAACSPGQPGDRNGAIATTPDAEEDCFDESCWTDPWGLFEPPPPWETTVSTDEPIVYDAGVVDAGPVDAGASDAPPIDAPCAGEPEPACPQPPPGAYSPQNPGIPSGGLCRGACGQACPKTCVAGPPASTCVSWQTADCKRHAKTCTYGVLSCGSHAGCRTHDTCYDACAGLRGVAYQKCRRACDVACITTHGARKCGQWMLGKGPFDSWLDFTAAPTTTTKDGTCP